MPRAEATMESCSSFGSDLPVLTDGGGPAETAGNRGFGDAGLADQGFKSGINEQISHLTFVQNVESNEYATYSP